MMKKIVCLLALAAAMSGCAATGELLGSVLGAAAASAPSNQPGNGYPQPAPRRDTSVTATGIR
ncbi:hypothetical protein [Massilia glaciei]|uniref:Lipoprotein n=1 Tax=Massilia glaciei TaxID=1524097 RepID=A0A2U2HGT1_9BURK|nr:hypothetical protein [Massilia glaciei]PWF44655.1 hypothetical protein C7C56_019145 [Massilia glaciei]